MSIRRNQPSIIRADRQLLLFQTRPSWADRFPAIAAAVEGWGRRILPWGDLTRCALIAIERRCNDFVFRLRNDSGHRWHISFHQDGRAWASGAGWRVEGNDADVELLEVTG